MLALLSRVYMFPARSGQRFLVCFALVLAIVGVVWSQIHAYQWVTRHSVEDDSFVMAAIVVENLFSAFLTLYVAYARNERGGTTL